MWRAVIFFGTLLALPCCAQQLPDGVAWEREAGVRITHWPRALTTDIYVTVELPAAYVLVGPPTTQFTPKVGGGDRLTLETHDNGARGKLIVLEAHFVTPVQLPFYPIRFTVRVASPTLVPAPIDVQYIRVLLADGRVLPFKDELQWETLIQSSPDGNFEPLD